MSYQDTEPASEGVTPEVRYGDIELDKSQDGRYWQVVYWPDDTVVLRTEPCPVRSAPVCY